jgi:hypothetical protein
MVLFSLRSSGSRQASLPAMTGPGSQLAVLLYGLDLLAASLIMNAIIRRLPRRPRLLVDYVAVDDSHWMVRRRRTGLILNGLG